MYLHLGADRVLRTDRIIGIFDLDTSTIGPDTRHFLSRAQRAGHVESIGDDLPKSFVLAEGDAGGRVYIGPLNTPTIKSRLAAGL